MSRLNTLFSWTVISSLIMVTEASAPAYFKTDFDQDYLIISICFAIASLIYGVISTFFGKKLIRAITGFSFLIFAFIIIFAIQVANTDIYNGSGTFFIFYIIGFFVVCVVAIFFYRFPKVGIVFNGFILGSEIMGMIWDFAPEPSRGLLIGLDIGLGVITAVLTYIHMDLMIVVSTSFIGASNVISGIVTFIGLVNYNRTYYSYNGFAESKTLPWGELVGQLALFIIGLLIQFYCLRNVDYLPTKPKNEETENSA